MHPSSILIHCQPTLLDTIREHGYKWNYSPRFGHEELDVVVDDVPYEVIDGTYQDPDEQLCEFSELDYNQINCVEALY